MPDDTIRQDIMQEPANTLNSSNISPDIGGDTEEQLVSLLQDITDKLDELTTKVDNLEQEMQNHGQSLDQHKQETTQAIQDSSAKTTSALTAHITNLLHGN